MCASIIGQDQSPLSLGWRGLPPASRRRKVLPTQVTQADLSKSSMGSAKVDLEFRVAVHQERCHGLVDDVYV
jgi:hypothetical protein